MLGSEEPSRMINKIHVSLFDGNVNKKYLKQKIMKKRDWLFIVLVFLLFIAFVVWMVIFLLRIFGWL